MKQLVCWFIFSAIGLNVTAQKYVVEESTVDFFSHAAVEDIAAGNKKTAGIFNISTNDIAFSIPINEFEFTKSLMQEHFNEKYMESDKFPKATFQGEIMGFNPEEKGVQQVKAQGKLFVHGITHDINVPGTIENSVDKLIMKSKFMVKLVDYKITIPQLLWRNIAEEVEVSCDLTFKPQK